MKIGIVGLGYVGLPLACLFAKKYEVVGFDINSQKIGSLKKNIDHTNELDADALKQDSLFFTNDALHLKGCDVIIVAVPTDIDKENQPDLFPLRSAASTIGKILEVGTTVVFESTVYPGLTEEICIPVLERESNLVWKKDFYVGYSPERINPGDKTRPLHKILKIVSGDTPKTLALLSELYGSVIEAGIYQAPDIKTAEAAKVIENAQRDLNIAFMNELAVIFDRMNVDTREVLKAAATKWNFLTFEPGLVGGYCIGVDPYYLTFKAEQLGYSPQVIHSGRHLNNNMGSFIADKVVKVLSEQKKVIEECKVLILGCSFKENVGEARNSKVFDIEKGLGKYQVQVDFVDPYVDADTLNVKGYRVKKEMDETKKYDAVILAVKHDAFKNYSLGFLQSVSVAGELNLFDVKAFFNKEEAMEHCKFYWRL
ncbi:UDP-N-acetyl-D-glucosamine 6-dehydrogenase [mine drainage metagenome]|uniref:UDP-N-acetyl-D-glucosamine 6-dehydrogenase n=1 Tax=mine drainage metagenome TaxID=410659 RepID=A0A1J5T7A7_9ZZZZ